MTATLTVCTPTFNRAGLLAQTLSSLCDQGLAKQDFVVAISDNASADDTPAVVDRFRDRLQIDYHRQPRNIGRIPNTQAVLKMCKTRYLTWLNDDDLLAPGQLRRALSVFESIPDVVLVSSIAALQGYPGDRETSVHGTFLKANHQTSYAEPYLWDTTEWFALALVTTPLSLIGSVFTNDLFQKLDRWKPYIIWGDRLLLAEMALYGRVAALPWIGSYYRIGGHQANAEDFRRNHQEFHAVTGELLEMCGRAGIDVAEFWADYLHRASLNERTHWAKRLRFALPPPTYQRIIETCHTRMGDPRLPALGYRLLDITRQIRRRLKLPTSSLGGS